MAVAAAGTIVAGVQQAAPPAPQQAMRAAHSPKYVKVIVCDYAADLLGSSIVKLK